MLQKKVGFILSVLLSLALCSYEPGTGEKLCWLAVSSYCNLKNVENWSCLPCQKSGTQLEDIQLFFNSSGDSVGLAGISHSDNAIMLVFRGTEPWDLKNWIEDINFIPTTYPLCDNGCHVHRGFYDLYKQIQKNVSDCIHKYRNKYGYDKIMVSGHSLGGALATHAIAHLHAEGIEVSHFYTFGSPRVGDPKFVKWFEGMYRFTERARVTHGRDPVPHLPPLEFSFLHVIHEIFYKGNFHSSYRTCTDTLTKEDPQCSDQYLVDPNVLDHTTYYDIDFAGLILACQA